MNHYTVDEPGPRAFSDAIRRLACEGKRSFLLCGAASDIRRELLPALGSDTGGASIAVCGDSEPIQGGDADAAARILAPPEAFARDVSWDVVVLYGNARHAHVRKLVALQKIPDVVQHKKQAEKVVVVSINKGGSHLVAELLKTLGYLVIGPMGGGEDRPSPFEVLDVQGSAKYRSVFVHWLELGPRNYVHLKGWALTGKPPLLFNYRDPRDVVCSFVHYLMNVTGRPVTPIAQHLVKAQILQNLETHEERLSYALRDPDVCLKHFQMSEWLLLHPYVCKLAFEDLVGPAGGGTADSQLRQVVSVMLHLGVPGDAMAIAKKIFNPDTRTFFRGQTGAWRREFKLEQVELANRLYGDVLDVYGYPRA